jgi:hypothetical protein
MFKFEKLSSLLYRVEFWILLFFIIRLIGITNPSLEIAHNWRQVTGLMVARNFEEVDNNIFYPRVDDNQGKTGIIGMEFPSLNYIHYLISEVWGYADWYGRLINLIISSIGIFYFYKIVRQFFYENHAFSAALFLLSSIWFSFSRKMMPDTYCISLMFIGIYYGLEYLNKAKIAYLLMYLFFTSLAILSKIPASIYFVLFLPMIFLPYQVKSKLIISLSTLIPLLLSFSWYFVWNPHLVHTYGGWYNIGMPVSEGFVDIFSHLRLTLERFYFSSFYSFIAFSSFVFGIYLMIRRKNRKLIITFTLLSCVFFVYILKSGYFFYHHDYYIIPFVPIMALVAGFALSAIKNRTIYWLVMSAVILESTANQKQDFFIKSTEKYKLELADIANRVSAKNDLIAINGNENPQQIYLTHRKGWTINDPQLNDSLYLNDIAQKGCKYVFINKSSTPILLNKDKVFENTHFVVYQLFHR